jgi:hypothetical protein
MAKEYTEFLPLDLNAYVENHFHTSVENLADWQRVKLSTDLHPFRKCKGFSDTSENYHPCEDCKSLVRCREQVGDEVSYEICNRCLEGQPY